MEPVIGGFDEFYSNAWSEVYRAVVLVVRDRDLAGEAVDEAMARAYTRWSTVSAMRNPRGWVYRVAVNWSKTSMRRRAILARLPIPTERQPGEPNPPPDPELINAVLGLRPEQRDVVVAKYVLDMSQEQIAETFGLSVGTVKSRLSRATAKLREELSS